MEQKRRGWQPPKNESTTECRALCVKIDLTVFLYRWCNLEGLSNFPKAPDQFSSVQSLSCIRLFVTPWTAACQASLSITNSQSLLKLLSIESVTPSNHLILCRPLLPLPSTFSSIRYFQMSQLFASGGQRIGVSASASVLPMNIQDWSPLGWTDLISLQSKRLFRVFSNTNSSKASILRPSAFFIVQLSHPYKTTGKAIALTRWTFVGKVMSLLFNMLSRLVITFLPRDKRLLISWIQSPLQWFWSPQKIVSHCFHCFPTYLPWSDRIGYCDLCFLIVDL